MDIQAEKLLLIEQLLRTNDTKVLADVRVLLNKAINPIVTEAQRREVLIAYEESEDESNLLDKSELFEKD